MYLLTMFHLQQIAPFRAKHLFCIAQIVTYLEENWRLEIIFYLTTRKKEITKSLENNKNNRDIFWSQNWRRQQKTVVMFQSWTATLCSSRKYPCPHHGGNSRKSPPSSQDFPFFEHKSNPPPPLQFPLVLCTPPTPSGKNSFGKKVC